MEERKKERDKVVQEQILLFLLRDRYFFHSKLKIDVNAFTLFTFKNHNYLIN